MISIPYIDSSQTHSLLHQILSSTSEAVVAEDLDGKLLAVNSRFLDLIGWRQTFTGQTLDQLVTAWATEANELLRYFEACRSGQVGPEPRELQPAVGQIIEARFLSAGSDAPYRLWFFQEWRTSALAWVSHEIKNPLNAVLGFTEVLQEQLADHPSPGLGQSLLGLSVGARHLKAVIGDLLDLSRLEAGTIEPRLEWTDPAGIVSDLETLFRTRFAQRGLDFVVDAPKSGVELWTDAGRVTQILSNLLSNSLRFTKRGWVALRVSHEDNTWTFAVEDSGVGIPHDQQKTIFDPFMQTKGQSSRQYGGTGLGLAICRNLAVSLGADLSLESEPGHGSRFSLTLPTKTRERLEEVPGVTVLVADDEHTNFLVIQAFLRGRVRLVSASDGQQAVEQWKRHRPAVVLLDLKMPIVSGLEAARRIRALDPEGSTKLLAMSATTFTATEAAEGRHLWAGFLEKPFGRQELLNFLSKHVTLIDDSSKSS